MLRRVLFLGMAVGLNDAVPVPAGEVIGVNLDGARRCVASVLPGDVSVTCDGVTYPTMADYFDHLSKLNVQKDVGQLAAEIKATPLDALIKHISTQEERMQNVAEKEAKQMEFAEMTMFAKNVDRIAGQYGVHDLTRTQEEMPLWGSVALFDKTWMEQSSDTLARMG